MLSFSQFTLILDIVDNNELEHDIDVDYTMYVGLKVFAANTGNERYFTYDSSMIEGGIQMFSQVSMAAFLLGALSTLF